MPSSPNLWLACVPGLGMVLVALSSVGFWRRMSHAGFRWFLIGAALWSVAVAVKFAGSSLINPAVIGWLKSTLPPTASVAIGGLYIGAVSSLCEVGLTLMAVKLWPRIGRNPDESIAIGVGAGAFEAFLLGVAALLAVAVAASSLPQGEVIRREMAAAQATIPLFWLLGPLERMLALMVHAGSRALVLLGSVRQRWGMVVAGFLLFAAVDAIAGAYHLSQTRISLWMIELAFVPVALVGLAAILWCRRLGEH